jgi:hypothetical protein
MGIYKNMQSAFVDMVYDLITDEDLCKLLYYDSYNPLSEVIVPDPSKMIYKGGDIIEEDYHRIFLTPKIPVITDEKKTLILPKILEIQPVPNDIYYKYFDVTFDILTHISLWCIANDELRVFEIMDKINKKYDKKYKTESIGWAVPNDTPYIYANEKWCGYSLSYRFTNWDKLCRNE